MEEKIIGAPLAKYDYEEINLKPEEIRTNIYGLCQIKLINGSFEMISAGHGDVDVMLKCKCSTNLQPQEDCYFEVYVRNFLFSITAGSRGCKIILKREYPRRIF